MRATSGFVLHQRRAGHDVADLLRRAAHVDVDDLGTAVGVVACGFGHHRRVGAGDLDRDRLDFAVVVGAAPGLLAAVEQRVGGDHLGHGQPCAHLFAQLAERAIRDPGHRSKDEVVAQSEAGKLHRSGRTRKTRILTDARRCG